MRSSMKRGFTLIELLVVIAIIAILASILFPVFAKARAKARQATCNSNVRQIALAIQMYAQDNNGQYPGTDGPTWVAKIAPYLGGSQAMFQCPEDTSKDSGAVSYGLAGILIRKDQTGVKEANVLSPSEVGCVADAAPSEQYSNGRLIGGGGQVGIEVNGATIETRHSKGAIVGYCDGHAKYFQGSINEADLGNGAVRALIAAQSLGLVDNPVGCLQANTGIAGSGTVIVGGEYAAYPLVMAAALTYGNYYTAGFKGASYSTGRPGTGWVWGTVSGSAGVATSAIAYDALVFIVAKGSKIPALPTKSNDTYAVSTATLQTLFAKGYDTNSVQVYKMNTTTATHSFVKWIVGLGDVNPYGVDPVEVANDLEMVEKVSNDPYGIGYCSSVYADPDRVTILAMDGMGAAGADAVWPRSSKKFRWVIPSYGESDWPYKRSINVNTSGVIGDTLAESVAAALRTGNFGSVLKTGPLFKCGYWPGVY